MTTIYVTHDQMEAMTMGDRVVVMRKGQIQQVASPEELYERPTNLFVAGFIGSPAMNLVETNVSLADGGLSLQFAGHRLGLSGRVMTEHPALVSYAGRSLILGIRPEGMEDAKLAPTDNGSAKLRVVVDLREALGSDVLVHFRLSAPPVVTEETRELEPDLVDSTAPLLADQTERNIFVARLNARSLVREGDTVDLSVDPRALHFFDPATGVSVRGRAGG